MGFEFYAGKDLYTVISNCPYADQALPLPEADPNPVYTSVWDAGIAPETNDHLGIVKRAEWEEMIYAKFAAGEKDISER